jgi:hypothetical protein
MGAIGSRVPPQQFKCGGWTGCEHDHDFYRPEDVLYVHLAIPVETFREDPHIYSTDKEAEAVRDGLLYVNDKAVIPTALGLWYEDCAAN